MHPKSSRLVLAVLLSLIHRSLLCHHRQDDPMQAFLSDLQSNQLRCNREGHPLNTNPNCSWGMESDGSKQGSDTSEGGLPYTGRGLQLVAAEGTELVKVNVLDLRPTQLAVGRQQVGEKAAKIVRKRLVEKPKKLDKFLRKKPIPVVLGPAPPGSSSQADAPSSAMYLVDHHHLACALLSQGITHCYVQVMEDWHTLPWMDFWKAMHDKACVWTHGADGQELDLASFVQQLPTDIRGLGDDPMRSLAALVRQKGGYDKVWVPFSEFRWANWFRAKVPLPAGVSPDDPAVLHTAILQAHTPAAAHLPGYKPAGTD